MGWQDRWELDSARPVEQFGVPLRLLRHLVASCNLRFGARVLEIAASEPVFAPAFAELGIETVELSPDDSGRADDHLPPLVCDGEKCDLVLAHAAHPFFANLRAPRTVFAAAEWAARINAGGAFVLLASRDADGRPAGHALSCYRSLLSRFAGTVECEEISDGTLWQRLRGEAADQGWFATILRVQRDMPPVQALPLSQQSVHESADRACCNRATLWTAARGRAAA